MSPSVQHTRSVSQSDQLHLPETTLYYEILGEASDVPLVILNGGPGRSHKNLRLSTCWESLAQRRQLVFYDQRGTGNSVPLSDDTTGTLADQLADLDALRQHLGATQIDLLGHSWGGFLGMAYTAAHPKHVRRLILVGSAAAHPPETVTLFQDIFPEIATQRQQLKPAMRQGDPTALAAAERLYFSMLCYTSENRDQYAAQADPGVLNLDIAFALGNEIAQLDLQPSLAEFQLPVLIITGRFDTNVAPIVAFRLHQQIPGSQLVVFEQSGHLPFYEEPTLFAETVSAFLDHT